MKKYAALIIKASILMTALTSCSDRSGKKGFSFFKPDEIWENDTEISKLADPEGYEESVRLRKHADKKRPSL